MQLPRGQLSERVLRQRRNRLLGGLRDRHPLPQAWQLLDERLSRAHVVLLRLLVSPGVHLVLVRLLVAHRFRAWSARLSPCPAPTHADDHAESIVLEADDES